MFAGRPDLNNLDKDVIDYITKLEVRLKESYKLNEYLEDEIYNYRISHFRKFEDDECWIYDPEGENYLDSLVCPVVISPKVLKQLEEYKWMYEDLQE